MSFWSVTVYLLDGFWVTCELFFLTLLFALPLLEGDSTINITTDLESASYVDITIDALKQFGIEIQREENAFFIKGNQKYSSINAHVEGDYSNSAFLDAFNILGGDVDVFGLNEGSIQGDKIYKEYFERINSGTPTLDISSCPDLGPVLFALASLKNGAIFTGTKRTKRSIQKHFRFHTPFRQQNDW